MEKKTGYDAATMKAKARQAKNLVAIRKARLEREVARLAKEENAAMARGDIEAARDWEYKLKVATNKLNLYR